MTERTDTLRLRFEELFRRKRRHTSPAQRRTHFEVLEERRLLAQNPVAHWALNETSGNLAADSSGNRRSLSLINGPVWTAGVQGNGLQFDGANDYGAAGKSAAILGRGAFTVAAWVRTSATGEQVILQQRSPAAFNGEYVLQTTNDGRVRFWMFGEGAAGANAFSEKRVNDGNWHHVAAVREADGTARIYLDGSPDGMHAAPARSMASIEVFVGADVRDGSRYFQGGLDDIRIYDRRLTVNEIQALASLGAGKLLLARDDSYAARLDQVLVEPAPALLANDEPAPLVITAADRTSGRGAVVQVRGDGSFRYDPRGLTSLQSLAPGQFVQDQFQYTVGEAGASGPAAFAASTATVLIALEGINDLPETAMDIVTTVADLPVTLFPLRNDRDLDQGDRLTLVGVDLSGTCGRVTLGTDNSLTYDPTGSFGDLLPGQIVRDTFQYTVADQHGGVAVGTVVVNVRGPFEPPDAEDDRYATTEDVVLSESVPGLLGNDVSRSRAPIPQVGPGNFYVTPQGSSSGDGSLDDPWDLETVLAHPAGVGPGATIWLREGVYRGKFHSYLTGTAEAPITVRAFPGEHVRIDLYHPANGDDVSFFVFGSYSVFQGLEVMSSDPGPRTTTQSGSFQTDVRRGGISVRGHHNKFINLVVHDLNAGMGYWGDGGEVYGSIFYNNGWLGPDRAHGHGLYVQNEAGVKFIEDNITFNQFSAGIHAYGSTRASLKDVHFQGNVTFNNGGAAGAGFVPERDLLVGGEMISEGIVLRENYSYQRGLNGAVDVGYSWGPENRNLRVQNNYIAGQFRFLQAWDQVEFTGNKVVSPVGRLIELDTPTTGSIANYEWDRNHYVSPTLSPFVVDGTVQTFATWRSTTRFDARSTYEVTPSGTDVFVRPNKYEAGRAHVIVYNWGLQPQVEVDLSQVLRVGDPYEIRSVVDVLGAPLASGIFDGGVISLPLAAVQAPAPTGYRGSTPVGTDLRFGTFLVTSPLAGSSPVPLHVVTYDPVSMLGAQVSAARDGSFTYDPRGAAALQEMLEGETVVDRFAYTAHDRYAGDKAFVSVTVQGRNDPPAAIAADFQMGEDDAATDFVLVVDDADRDDTPSTLAYALISQPARGAVADLGGGRFTFDPRGEFESLAAGQTDTQVFSYRVEDSHGTATLVQVTMTIRGANDAPTAADDRLAVAADRVLNVASPGLLSNDSDPDAGTVLRISSPRPSVTDAGVPVSVGEDGSLRYDPTAHPAWRELLAGEMAEDRFVYSASDGIARATATVTLSIEGRNDAPVVSSGMFSVAEDGPPLTGSISADDPDRDEDASTLVYELVSLPARGTLTDLGGGRFTFHPNGEFESLGAGQTASLPFAFQVTDSHGAKTVAWSTLVVEGANDAPVGTNDSYAEFSDTVLTVAAPGVLANDHDIDQGDSRRIVNPGTRTTPAGARLTLNADGSFRYDPLPSAAIQSLSEGAMLTDSFDYQVQDSLGLVSSARVSLQITRALARPVTVAGAGRYVLTREAGSDVMLVYRDGQLLARQPLHMVSHVAMTGGAGTADSLTIRFTDGNPIPKGGVRWDGLNSGGADELVLEGGTFETAAVRYGQQPGSGTIELVSNSVASNVSFQQIESLKMHTPVDAAGIFLSEGSDRAAIHASESGFFQLTGATITSTRFARPAQSLTLDGRTGDDLVEMSGSHLAWPGVDVSLAAEQLDVRGSVRTLGGDFRAAGRNFVSSGAGSIRTGGGEIQLSYSGDVRLGAEVATDGGPFSIVTGGTFLVSNYLAAIRTNGTSSGGPLSIDAAGDVTVFALYTGGGTADIRSQGNVTINGRVDTRGTGTGGFRSSGVSFRSARYADIYSSGGNIGFVHSGAVVLGDLVSAGGGAILVTAHSLTTDTFVKLQSGGGDVRFRLVSDALIRDAISTEGGAFDSESQQGAYRAAAYLATIKTVGTRGAGQVLIRHPTRIEVYGITTGGGNVTLAANDLVWLRGPLDTRGGTGGSVNSSGNAFTSENYAEIVTGGGRVSLVHQGLVTLGERIETAGGGIAIIASQLATADSGASVRSSGGAITLNVMLGADFKGGIDTGGAPLHVTLHVRPDIISPLLNVQGTLDFAPGSTVTVDMDGYSMNRLIERRVPRIIRAQRFLRASPPVSVIDTALGDPSFVASLVDDRAGGLELVLTGSK